MFDWVWYVVGAIFEGVILRGIEVTGQVFLAGVTLGRRRIRDQGSLLDALVGIALWGGAGALIWWYFIR